MEETASCPFCESEISPTASKCRHCGEWVSRNCLGCGTPVRDQWAARGFCADCGIGEGAGVAGPPAIASGQVPYYSGLRKSRSVSVGLALVLGTFGAHKIYLEKPGRALLYMLFSWSGVPTIIGLVEAVKYIRMDEEEFHHRFLRGDL